MALPDVQVEQPAVERHLAGEGEYRCTVCGYAAIAPRPPESCPMCQCAVWEWAPWRPFSRNPLLAGTQRLRLSERLRLR